MNPRVILDLFYGCLMIFNCWGWQVCILCLHAKSMVFILYVLFTIVRISKFWTLGTIRTRHSVVSLTTVCIKDRWGWGGPEESGPYWMPWKADNIKREKSEGKEQGEYVWSDIFLLLSKSSAKHLKKEKNSGEFQVGFWWPLPARQVSESWMRSGFRSACMPTSSAVWRTRRRVL